MITVLFSTNAVISCAVNWICCDVIKIHNSEHYFVMLYNNKNSQFIHGKVSPFSKKITKPSFIIIPKIKKIM